MLRDRQQIGAIAPNKALFGEDGRDLWAFANPFCKPARLLIHAALTFQLHKFWGKRREMASDIGFSECFAFRWISPLVKSSPSGL
ncbi:MAG: hypothetical protein ACREXM_20620, partial [Gammaproteobacteria bacterium]